MLAFSGITRRITASNTYAVVADKAPLYAWREAMRARCVSRQFIVAAEIIKPAVDASSADKRE